MLCMPFAGRNHLYGHFTFNVLTFFSFLAFSTNRLKKHIQMIIESAQYLNAGQNIQHLSLMHNKISS